MPHEPRTRAGRRLLLLVPVLLLAPALVLGAEIPEWEGNAAVVRQGEFTSPGLFAASDSFPIGALLRVENPQNGNTVQVTVLKRINAQGSVFLLLSEQAAAALGFSASEVIRIKARVLSGAGGVEWAGAEELASSPDPDINPAAALADRSGRQPAAEPAAVEEQAPAAAPEEEAAPAAAAIPEAAIPPAGSGRLEELAARTPQKQLFQPQRGGAALEPPVVEPSALAQAEEPADTPSAEAAPLPAQELEELPLAEAAVAEEAPPEETPALSLGAPAAEEAPPAPLAEAAAPMVEEAPLEPALVEAPPVVEAPPPVEAPPVVEAPPIVEAPPTVEAPPIVEAPPVVEAPPAVAAVPSSPPPPSSLVRRAFYLQLGAYSTRSLADKLAQEISGIARFTVAVLPVVSGSRQLFKVLIGPLNRDESGTLLYQFRARGFKDAFVQFVE